VIKFPPVILPVTTVFVGKSIVIVPFVVIGLPLIVNEVLETITLVTVPVYNAVVAIVTAPLLPLSDIPDPAVKLVTPIFVTVILPLLVIGPPVTAMPAPGVILTLVTVPTEVVETALVILPYWSIIIVGAIYVPLVTPELPKSNVIIPELTIGPPDEVILTLLAAPTTLILETPDPALPVEDIVTLPFPLVTVILVPATILVTPVFVIVIVPLLALLEVLIPAPFAKVLYGLAQANKLAKLFAVLLNAVYSESLPNDSFCNPIFITCRLPIAMIYPYIVFINGD